MVGASHAASGTSMWNFWPPASAFRVASGRTIPQACEVADRSLPLATKVVLSQMWTGPDPATVPAEAGQVEGKMMWSATVYVLSAGQSALPGDPPDPVTLPP